MLSSLPTKIPQCSLLKQINTCGRNVPVLCEDDELYENEVILTLLLYHQFQQIDIKLEEGTVLILPDYTAETFVQLKMDFLNSENSMKSLFFPGEYIAVKEINIQALGEEHHNATEPVIYEEKIKNKVESENNKGDDQNYTVNLEIDAKTDESIDFSDFDNPQYKCEQCKSVLLTKKSLKCHIKYAHEGMHFLCEICSEKFTSKHSLKVHNEAIHLGVRYSCNYCEYIATTAAHLRIHRLAKHPAGELVQQETAGEILIPYKCDLCDSVLKNRKSLNGHIKYKHEGIRFSCSDCSETFTSKSSMKVHHRSLHLGERYSCNECEYIATTTGHLREHTQIKHSGQSFSCDQCTYKTTQTRGLKHHISSKHEGTKYHCDDCDFFTMVEEKLKFHKKTLHDKAYQITELICDECGYTTEDQQRLTRHKIGKHEEPQFQCDQCTFRTGWDRSLRKHKKEHHNLETR